ncbi:MAG: hypothetical protein ACR2FH_01565 [Caulobacteraceae bacterium]
MNRKRSILAAILLGGLIAGTVDIGAAALITGLSPIVILRAVASGVLGKASFDGGTGAAVLGLVLQWAMSLVIAAIYGLASLRDSRLLRWWIVCGLAYGVGVFLVMNYVVVPLSAVGHFPRFTPLTFGENLLAMLLFGLIVAFFARRRNPIPPEALARPAGSV